MSGDVEDRVEGDMVMPTPAPYPPPPAYLPSEGPQPYPVGSSGLMPGQTVTIVIVNPPAQKTLCEAYILCVFFGFFGWHHFYLGRSGMGVLYLLTVGVFGIGWIIDLIRLPWLVKEANHRIMHPEEDVPTVGLCDAYITWFPLGIIGIHHYYLRNWGWGVAYTFTGGLFGIGWLVDAFRLPSLVRSTNKRLEEERMNAMPPVVSLCNAYAFGATPLGIFGAHHFYMGRKGFGMFYLMTLGLCGFGWIVDWFRMKWLVHRTNHPEEKVLGNRHKFLDDAYVLHFPFGILGFHYFYLERDVWGLIYMFTLGLFGIGWLVDLFRMPWLVSGANKRLEDELRMVAEIREQLGMQPTTVIISDYNYQQPPNGTVPSINPNFPPQQQLQQPPSYEESTKQSTGAVALGGGMDVPSEGSHQNSGFENERV